MTARNPFENFFPMGLTSADPELMLSVETGSNHERIGSGRTEDRETIGSPVVASVGDPGDCRAAAGVFVAFRNGPQSAGTG